MSIVVGSIDLLSCDICHGLEPTLCPECKHKQAFRCEDGDGYDCYECHVEMNEAWVSSPMVDPDGLYQSHYCHKECLPHGSIPVD